MATVTVYVKKTPHLYHYGEKTLFIKVDGKYHRTPFTTSDRVYFDQNYWRGPRYEAFLEGYQEKELKEFARKVWKERRQSNVINPTNLIFVGIRIHLQTCSHCGHVV